MATIKQPTINAKTTQGQVEQIKDYLFQLVKQLSFELEQLQKANEKGKE